MMINLDKLNVFISKNVLGECMIDLHAWVMYIPLGNEKAN